MINIFNLCIGIKQVMEGTSKYDKHESKENYKRRTKAIKGKETYEKNGKMSSKHLRIQEALKNARDV